MKKLIHVGFPVTGNPDQLLPGLIVIFVLGTKLPDLSSGADCLSADGWQMYQKETSGPDGIVTGLLHNHQSEVCLMEDGKLPGQVEHAGVGADQTIPLLEVMQRKQQLPIIHPSKPWIDSPYGNQLCLGNSEAEGVDDGVRKILVEREASHVSGSSLETNVLLELIFEIDAVL